MDGICITKKEFNDFILMISYRLLALEERRNDLNYGFFLSLNVESDVDLCPNYIADIADINAEVLSLTRLKYELRHRYDCIRD